MQEVYANPVPTPEPPPTPPHDPLILKTLLAQLEQGGPERAREILLGSIPKTRDQIIEAHMVLAPTIAPTIYPTPFVESVMVTGAAAPQAAQDGSRIISTRYRVDDPFVRYDPLNP